MTTNRCIITEDQQKEYLSGYLLYILLKKGKTYSVVLEDDDKDLEPVFIHMMAREYVDLDKDNQYMVTEKGKLKYDNYQKRYQEYLSHFDIYCAVDLEVGEFAFEQFFKLDDRAWAKHVNDERFDDVRIAVANFKKMNPVDIVFLSFLNEGRFGNENTGWQFDLQAGLVWRELEEVVDNAITIENLGYAAEDGEQVDGSVVTQDIITQGAQLCAQLHEEESKQNGGGSDGYIESTYRKYSNPNYVSPIWS